MAVPPRPIPTPDKCDDLFFFLLVSLFRGKMRIFFFVGGGGGGGGGGRGQLKI